MPLPFPPGVKFVHTPYSNAYDLVPVDSEEAVHQVDHHSAAGETDSVTDTSTPFGMSPTGPEHVKPTLAAWDSSLRNGISTIRGPQHGYLIGQCEFLDFNAECRIEQFPVTGRLNKLFVGHVTFEITAPQLRWIIQNLIGVTCGKIEPRGLGCYMVFLQNDDDQQKLKALHKRALFDENGVWFARTELQEGILNHFATTYLAGIHSHLPRGLIVVHAEVARKHNRNRGRRRRRRGGRAQSGNKQQDQQQGEEEEGDSDTESDSEDGPSPSPISS
jgi:hypothetical protein